MSATANGSANGANGVNGVGVKANGSNGVHTKANGAGDASADLPLAVDLSHHYSVTTRSRFPSPLKEIIKYMAYDGMISLAGGLPHPSLFPFKDMHLTAYPSDPALDPSTPAMPPGEVDLDFARRPTEDCAYGIEGFGQYADGRGLPALRASIREIVARVNPPAFKDWDVLCNHGSTDGINQVFQLLFDRGDFILTEGIVYSSTIAVLVPLGIRAVPIQMDEEGLCPIALDKALANWDESRGKRPKGMYLVPVGQNPTGCTMSLERRKAIYELAVKYDFIIIEDDPYSVLQFPPYELGQESRAADPTPDVANFLSDLSPSFVTLDYQGRVIRLDTFSKVLAPGSRLGWFTASNQLVNQLLRGLEVQVQAPSGFSQAIIGQLLHKWTTDGFVQWIARVREQYRVRRDWMVDAIVTEFDVVPASEAGVEGALGMVCFAKGSAASSSRVPIMSFTPPVGGMFVWVTFHYSSHPKWAEWIKNYPGTTTTSSTGVAEDAFEVVLWNKLVENKVLLTPGWYHEPWQGDGVVPHRDPGLGHMRIAYSFEPRATQDEGIRRLAAVLTEEWTGA